MLRPGDKIGPYYLIRQLGRGAFGIVWLAEKKSKITTSQFALKIALDQYVNLEEIKREVEVWKQASGHPNILPFIEADDYDDYVVIVSEHAKDGSLESWLKNEPLPIQAQVAAEIVIGILDGLQYLHSLGIIHRDLKPANVLMQGGKPRLADFGLARVLNTTQSSIIAGTPEYMAPEAFLNIRSEKTDLWSVGIMFYELLTGYLPFRFTRGMNVWEKQAVIATQEPLPLPHNMSNLLCNVIERSLKKDQMLRYDSANEMREAIVTSIRSMLHASEAKTILEIPDESTLINNKTVDEELAFTVVDQQKDIRENEEKPPILQTLKFHRKNLLRPSIAVSLTLLLILTIIFILYQKREAHNKLNEASVSEAGSTATSEKQTNTDNSKSGLEAQKPNTNSDAPNNPKPKVITIPRGQFLLPDDSKTTKVFKYLSIVAARNRKPISNAVISLSAPTKGYATKPTQTNAEGELDFEHVPCDCRVVITVHSPMPIITNNVFLPCGDYRLMVSIGTQGVFAPTPEQFPNGGGSNAHFFPDWYTKPRVSKKLRYNP